MQDGKTNCRKKTRHGRISDVVEVTGVSRALAYDIIGKENYHGGPLSKRVILADHLLEVGKNALLDEVKRVMNTMILNGEIE